jgi:signal transduction histidine kinase/CheY-like chemotaxis protein
MAEDWRFKLSPHVDEGGLRAYAGVPLRFETEYDQHVAFGSLCVASNSPQAELSGDQQRTLVGLADWIVADIIHSARGRRQRERRRMAELTTQLQKMCENGVNMEETILETLRDVYPATTVEIRRTTTGQIQLEGGTDFRTSELDQGLWEDWDCIDHMIKEFNHHDMVAPKIVRLVATHCASEETPTYLIVGSKDFRFVFDDVDSGFVQTCANILCRYWQSRALQEALKAKDTFLRGITHQLRTPIHGILGSVELLTEELRSRNVMPTSATSSPCNTPDMESLDPHVYIKTIRTSAHELISTVNSLIKLNQWADIAQAERETSLHKIAHVESMLLNEVSLMLPPDISARPSIFIQRRFPLNCDSIMMDVRLFVDCIQPLVVNAMQNTAGGVVVVTLSLAEDFQPFKVDVVDNGRGIDAIDHERIFNAYEKVDVHTVGAGLGLTLSCKSALLMNGHVSLVSSEVGRGSHFRAAFANPVCSSSLPPKLPVKQRLVQLPPTFHRFESNSRTSWLGDHFAQYLQSCGYIESSDPTGALIALDYTLDLGQLYANICRIAVGQVGICLVPECIFTFLEFDSKRFAIRDNVVFVQGPFLPSILDEVLTRADTLLAEFAAAPMNSGICASGGVAINDPQATLPTDTLLDVQKPPSPSLPTAAETELRQSLKSLRMGSVQTLRLSPNPLKPMALLVDDNAINLRLLEMYCSRREIPYRTAKDGAEAVRLFKHHHTPVDDPLLRQPLVTQPFDLVLMDLQMPVCDGIDATRQIRALEKENEWNKSVIFIVTGQSSPSDRNDAADAGSDGFLVKPVGPKDLDRWLKLEFPAAGL